MAVEEGVTTPDIGVVGWDGPSGPLGAGIGSSDMRGTGIAMVSVEGAEVFLRDTTEESVRDGRTNSVVGSRFVRCQWASFRRTTIQPASVPCEVELTRFVAPTPNEGGGDGVLCETMAEAAPQPSSAAFSTAVDGGSPRDGTPCEGALTPDSWPWEAVGFFRFF